MLDILYSKFCVHHRHPSACRAPSTDDNRAETRYGTDVKADANVGPENGSEHAKEPVLVAGVGLLLVLLLQAEGDLRWDSSFLLAFGPVRRVTDTGEGVRKPRNHASGDVLSVVYSYIWAATGSPSTTLIMMLSRYAGRH